MDQAVIFGDPGKPGIYGLLLRWNAGHFSRPHFHNTDRYAYVISGTWWVSSSDTYDLSNTYPMPAGSVVTDLANTVHYRWRQGWGRRIGTGGHGAGDHHAVRCQESAKYR